MKIKKLLSVLTACLLMTVICSGCTREPKLPEVAYNARIIADFAGSERKFIPDIKLGFTEKFWTENLVCVSYLNEDYDPNLPGSKKYLFDKTLPEEITHIVTSEEEYRKIYDKEHADGNPVDFEKEMLIVYVYAGGNGTKHYLWEVTLDDKELLIKYKQRIVTNDVVTNPKRSILVIKMDKLDIETVEFQPCGRI